MFTSKKQRAQQEIELRRGRIETFMEPLPIDTATDIPDFLSHFYRHILFQQRSTNQNEGIQYELQSYPTTTGKFYTELVLEQKIISHEDFWQRYFYRTNSVERVLNELDAMEVEKKKARTTSGTKFPWRSSSSNNNNNNSGSSLGVSASNSADSEGGASTSLMDLIPQRVLSSSVVAAGTSGSAIATSTTNNTSPTSTSSSSAVRSNSMFVKKTIFNDLIPKRKVQSRSSISTPSSTGNNNMNSFISPDASNNSDEAFADSPSPTPRQRVVVVVPDGSTTAADVVAVPPPPPPLNVTETIVKEELGPMDETTITTTTANTGMDGITTTTTTTTDTITTTNGTAPVVDVVADATVPKSKNDNQGTQEENNDDDIHSSFLELKQITSSSSMEVVDGTTEDDVVEVTPKPKFFTTSTTSRQKNDAATAAITSSIQSGSNIAAIRDHIIDAEVSQQLPTATKTTTTTQPVVGTTDRDTDTAAVWNEPGLETSQNDFIPLPKTSTTMDVFTNVLSTGVVNDVAETMVVDVQQESIVTSDPISIQPEHKEAKASMGLVTDAKMDRAVSVGPNHPGEDELNVFDEVTQLVCCSSSSIDHTDDDVIDNTTTTTVTDAIVETTTATTTVISDMMMTVGVAAPATGNAIDALLPLGVTSTTTKKLDEGIIHNVANEPSEKEKGQHVLNVGVDTVTTKSIEEIVTSTDATTTTITSLVDSIINGVNIESVTPTDATTTTITTLVDSIINNLENVTLPSENMKMEQPVNVGVDAITTKNVIERAPPTEPAITGGTDITMLVESHDVTTTASTVGIVQEETTMSPAIRADDIAVNGSTIISIPLELKQHQEPPVGSAATDFVEMVQRPISDDIVALMEASLEVKHTITISDLDNDVPSVSHPDDNSNAIVDSDVPSASLKGEPTMLPDSVQPDTAASVSFTEEDFMNAIQSNNAMAATSDEDFPQPAATTTTISSECIETTREAAAIPNDIESTKLRNVDSLTYPIIDSMSLISLETQVDPIASTNVIDESIETKEIVETTIQEDTKVYVDAGSMLLTFKIPTVENEVLSAGITDVATLTSDAAVAVVSDVQDTVDSAATPPVTDLTESTCTNADAAFDVVNPFDDALASGDQNVDAISIPTAMIDSMPLTPDVFQSWNTSTEDDNAASNMQATSELLHDAFDPFAVATPRGIHSSNDVPISFTPGVDGVPGLSSKLDTSVISDDLVLHAKNSTGSGEALISEHVAPDLETTPSTIKTAVVQLSMDSVDKLLYEEFGVEQESGLYNLASTRAEQDAVETHNVIDEISEGVEEHVAADPNTSSEANETETKATVDVLDVVEQLSKLNDESGFTTFGNVLKAGSTDANAEIINSQETLEVMTKSIGTPAVGLDRRLGDMLMTKKRKQSLDPTDIRDALEGFPSPKIAKHSAFVASISIEGAPIEENIHKSPKKSDGKSKRAMKPKSVSPRKSKDMGKGGDALLKLPFEPASSVGQEKELQSDLKYFFKSISSEDDREANLLGNMKSLDKSANGNLSDTPADTKNEEVGTHILSETDTPGDTKKKSKKRPSDNKKKAKKVVQPEVADSRAATPVTSNVDVAAMDRSATIAKVNHPTNRIEARVTSGRFISQQAKDRNRRKLRFRFAVTVLLGVAIAVLAHHYPGIIMVVIPVIDQLCGPVPPGWSSTDHPILDIVVAEAPFWVPNLNNTSIKRDLFDFVCGTNRKRTIMKLTPTKDNQLFYFELWEVAVRDLTTNSTKATTSAVQNENWLIKKRKVRSIQVIAANQIELTLPRGKVELFHPFWNKNGIGNGTTTQHA